MRPKRRTARRSTSSIPSRSRNRSERPANTRSVRLVELGRRRYRDALESMRALHARVASGDAPDTWLVVEHEPVVTLGRNAKPENLLLSEAELAARGIDLVRVERGGDATYHGPGQLVVYPVMKLARFREVAPMVAAFESGVVAMLAGFGIAARARPEHRGVYVGERAIAAIGLAVKQMTSLHGVALNVATALEYDRLITPCGTPEFGITSMSRELGRTTSLAEAAPPLLESLARSFGVELVRGDGEPSPDVSSSIGPGR